MPGLYVFWARDFFICSTVFYQFRHTPIRILLLLAVAFIYTACDSNGGYLTAIPGESTIITKIDVVSFIQKSDIANEETVKKDLNERFSILSEPTRKILHKMGENPTVCGIDLRKPIIIAFKGDMDNPSGVLSIAIKDYDKFNTFISTILEKDIFLLAPVKLIEKEDMNVLDVLGNDYAAYDDEKFVVSLAKKNPNVLRYMNQPENEQALNDNLFKPFFADKSDITLTIDYKKLYNLSGDLVNLSTINFENGKIAIKYTIDGNEEGKKYYEENIKKDNNTNIHLQNYKDTRLYHELSECGFLSEIQAFLSNSSIPEQIQSKLKANYNELIEHVEDNSSDYEGITNIYFRNKHDNALCTIKKQIIK